MGKTWLSKLKKLWASRLAESGFVDIENVHGRLKVFDGSRFATEKDWLASQEYFRDAYQFAHAHNFESGLHKRVWLYHSLGKSNVDIGIELQITPYVAVSIIQQYKKQMLLKNRGSSVLPFKQNRGE